MTPQRASTKINFDPDASADTRLQGRRLIGLRAAWLAVALLTLGLFAAGIPARFEQLLHIAEEYRPALLELGLSVNFYGVYFTALDLLIVLVHFGIAIMIFGRKSDDWMALLVSFTLVTAPLSFINALGTTLPASQALAAVVNYLGLVSSVSLLYLFPDGRFVPRWTRPLAAVWAGLNLPAVFLPGTPFSFPTWPLPLQVLLLLGWSASGVYAQLYRYLRVSGAEQQQQIRWAVLGLTAAVLGPIGYYLPFVTLPSLSQPSLPSLFYQLAGPTVFTLSLLYRLVSVTIFAFGFLLFPFSFAVAILRYRLWDIDFLINRAVVYSALTGIVVGLYVFVVGALGALFQVSGNLLLSILATGLIAILFHPLRQRLQRSVNRLMYGERDDPYAVISRLSQRLMATLAPEAVLPTIAETVAQTLRLPYVALTLKHADADKFTIVAEYGRAPSPGWAPGEALPLIYQSNIMGQLIAAPRASGEAFTPAEWRLLEDIARQAGVAAHAVRLTADLQRSRERLITAREEERRRLRRDLHDSLGPALASLTLKLDTARNLLAHDPASTDRLLAELKTQTQTAIADIRRLVYDLRPPALDELGLVSAICEQAAQYTHVDGLHVSIEAPERLPPLPAAVEVAAYRIVSEALTNVVRHARAGSCIVRFSVADRLCLEVLDDGAGLPRDSRAGVGLTSMRERAAELGGTCLIERAPTGGTRVIARLPLSRET
jgi:signal transduction histidine kinase